MAQCRQDLADSDADSNQRISQPEFLTFLEAFGERVCWERPSNSTELTPDEALTFETLICVATPACEGLSDILVAEPMFTGNIANLLCTITYSSGLGAPVCDGREAPTTASPTMSPDNSTNAPVGAQTEETAAPIQVPDNTGSHANRLLGDDTWTMMVVTGAATMLAYVWM